MRPTFVLRVRAESGIDAIRSLRAWLKSGWRNFGLRCLDVHQEHEGKSVMTINLNDVGTQRDREVIPDGVYLLKAQVIPGGVGEPGGMLRRGTKNKRQLMLELSCRVVGGDHDGHEIRDYPTVAIDESSNGDLPPLTAEQRQKLQTSLRLGFVRLRAIIDSAFRLDPNDRDSEEAKAKRDFDSYDYFNGLQFWAQVGRRPGGGKFDPSNQIDFVLVLGDPDYPEESKAVAPRGRWGDDLNDEVPF